ncbi:MAG: hypothetical protein DIU66_003230 [Bacillota bacterium]|nr:MAG: hypothetical protein DIU66_07040 [Bacillota bacterium]
MDIYVEDLIALFLIFALVVFLGLRAAEQGVNYMMGLEVEPRTFDVKMLPGRVYRFSVLGREYSLKMVWEVGEFYADRRRVDLRTASFDISIPAILRLHIPSGFPHLLFFLDK